MKPTPRSSDRPFARRWRLLLIALGASLCFSFGGVVAAQDEETSPAPEAEVSSRDHDTPRSVMRAFLSGMREYHDFQSYEEADLELALSSFALGEAGGDREAQELLAVQLYEVIKRLKYIHLEEEFSVELGGQLTWVWSPRGEDGQVLGPRLGFARFADGWRIDEETLRKVPRWYEAWKDKPLVTEVLERLDREADELSGVEWIRYRIKRSMPESLRSQAFLLENWQWVALALIALMGVIFGKLASFALRRLSRRLGESDRLEVDKQVLVNFERPFSFFVTAGTLLWTLPLLGLEPRFYDILRLAGALFVSVAGVWSAYRLVDVGAAVLAVRASRTANRFDDMLVPLLRRTAKLFLTVIGVVYVASFLSEDLYGIVAGLSIGSLAIGFAAKDSIENLFGTVTVLMDKPYQLGDWITVGEIDGTVEEVGFRSTKIRTFYNSVITVPNSRFISAHVDNWGARRYRRIRTMVSLAYGTPPLKVEAFCEAVRELIRKHPYTRKDYYHVYLNKLGASSLDVLLYCFVQTPDWSTELREKHRLYLDILRVAEGLEVELAFPTQTIHLAKDGPTEGEGVSFAEDSSGAERLGRELADLVVKEGMARFEGEKPPPVVIG